MFLGTSGSTPTKTRMMPSVALTYEGSVYLFDCGEGTQMQMMKFGMNFSKVRAIFISHMHGDHVIGLPGLLRTMALNGRKEQLSIYVPKGEEKLAKSLIFFDSALIKYNIEIKGVKGGIVYKGKEFSISSFKLIHSAKTYGYVFEEREKTRFLKDKCEKLGIKGEMFKTLNEKGKVKVNGRTISIGSISRKEKGKKIVYATDTRPCKNTNIAAKGADILIHEANYADEEKKFAIERKHSTSVEAAQVAKAAKVRLLIMTHISARYRNAQQLLDEAKQIFKNSEVAYDGYILKL